MGTARQLIAEDGARGLLRGLVPRMVNVALWGEPARLPEHTYAGLLRSHSGG